MTEEARSASVDTQQDSSRTRPDGKADRTDADLEPATLIIPTRDRQSLVTAALHAVAATACAPDEVLVIDQSVGCDGSIEALGPAIGLAIRHVHDRTPGASHARNLGARLASFETLLFIDDDVLVDPGWSTAIRHALRTQPVVTGSLSAADPERPGAFAPSTTIGAHSRTFTEPVGVDVLYTGNLGLQRSVLRGVGGFDERLGPGTRFPAAEDNDLAHRLLVSGVPIRFDSSVTGRHRAWRPGSALIGLRWRYGRGQGGFLAKHMTDSRGSTIARLASQLGRYGRRALRSSVRRRPEAAADIAFVLGLVAGLAEWLLTERRLRRVRGRRPGRTRARALGDR